MIDVQQIKEKLISFIKENGPSLPIPLSRHVEISPMFTSAILAELLGEKVIKVSNLKIGSSPLYLLQGQEDQLENFSNHLKDVKKEAFLRLKQRKILIDIKESPAIRVALRSLKDFAIPLKFQGDLIWKYFTTTNEEIKKIISQESVKKQEPIPAPQHIIPKRVEQEKVEQEIKQEPVKLSVEKPVVVEEEADVKIVKEKPLLEIKPGKKPKQVNTKFLEEIKEFLIRKDIEFLEDIESDKKQVIAIVRINSDLGKLKFLLIGKDKKRISTGDLTIAYQKAINEKMPCYFLSRAEPSKKIKEFLQDYKEIIKTDIIE